MRERKLRWHEDDVLHLLGIYPMWRGISMAEYLPALKRLEEVGGDRDQHLNSVQYNPLVRAYHNAVITSY